MQHVPGGPPAGSMRRTLIATGAAALVMVVVIALVAGLGLVRAEYVLTRTAFSREQLILANQLDSAVNAYAADAVLGLSHAASRSAAIESAFAQYRQSILAEHRFVMRHGGHDDADSELAIVKRLRVLFDHVRAGLDAGRDTPALAADLGRFRALVHATAAQERAEVGVAEDSFRQTRTFVGMTALVLPLLCAGLGGLGLWLVFARLQMPLRRFEQAMAALANGDRDPVGDLGFVEFAKLARGFDRMADEIETQREALAQANERLEADVVAQTAELRARNAQLSEIEANRRQFFAQISHELRTPITALHCEAEVALRASGQSVGDLREALEQVLVQGAVIRRRLSDLLAVSQAEDGKLIMAHDAFDLADALRGSLALAQPFARSNEVRIATDIADGAFPLLGDAGWMQQALLALVDNAVKFSPGEAVEVSLWRKAETMRLTIRDRGPGVPETALARLFDRFHQEPSGRARGGSGLGLSIARWVIDHHHGRITASNRCHGGLAINLTLPLNTKDRQDERTDCRG